MMLNDKDLDHLQACNAGLEKLISNMELQDKCHFLGKQRMVNPGIEFTNGCRDGAFDKLNDNDYYTAYAMMEEEAELWRDKPAITIDYAVAMKTAIKLATELRYCLSGICMFNKFCSDVQSQQQTGNWRDYMYECSDDGCNFDDCDVECTGCAPDCDCCCTCPDDFCEDEDEDDSAEVCNDDSEFV